MTGIILAGGKSSRMGFDKQFMIVDNELLIEKNIKILQKYFDDIIVISNNHKLIDLNLDSSIKIYGDDVKNCGPLGGIYTGLNKSKDNMNFIIPCDMPFIYEDYIKFLKNQVEENIDGIVTRYGDWIEPFYGFYNKNLKNDIKKYLSSGRRSIFEFIRDKNFRYIEEEKAREFSPDWKMFYNLNTKDDLNNLKVI